MEKTNLQLIKSIQINTKNLNTISKKGIINGSLLKEINRILNEKEKIYEEQRFSREQINEESLIFMEKCVISSIQGITASMPELFILTNNPNYVINKNIADNAYYLADEVNHKRLLVKYNL